MKVISMVFALILIPSANADYELFSGDTRSGTGRDTHKLLLQELRADASSNIEGLFRALLSSVIATRAGASVKKASEDSTDQDRSSQDSLEMGIFDESRWNEAVYDEKTASSRYATPNLLQCTMLGRGTHDF